MFINSKKYHANQKNVKSSSEGTINIENVTIPITLLNLLKHSIS